MPDEERACNALQNLPPFPPVASQVITALASEFISFHEISDILKTDAALSTEVLRLANSPLVASSRYEVVSILQALNVLGLKRLAGLVMTLSLARFLRRAGVTHTMRQAWHHNLACALAAREFAVSFGRHPDEAYNAGLFHDLGRLAFLVVEPEVTDGLIAADGDLRELERAHFGIDHCQAGAWVIERWKLPHVFSEVALFHHDPKPESGLLMLVNAACTVASRLGYSVRPPSAEESPLDPSDALSASIAEFIRDLDAEYGL